MSNVIPKDNNEAFIRYLKEYYTPEKLKKRCTLRWKGHDDDWDALKINPSDNILFTDADGCTLPNSLSRMEKEFRRIAPKMMSYDKLIELCNDLNEAKRAVNLIPQSVNPVAGWKRTPMGTFVPSEQYDTFMKRYASYEKLEIQLQDYYSEKDMYLEEVCPDNGQNRMNYGEVYKPGECIVDFKAFETMDRYKKDGSYKRVVSISFTNSDTEIVHKDNLLADPCDELGIPRIYVPYHLEPYYDENGNHIILRSATRKLLVFRTIFGTFNYVLCSYHDDSLAACDSAEEDCPGLESYRTLLNEDNTGSNLCANIIEGRNQVLVKRRQIPGGRFYF